jgi:hypothetical protein
VAQPVECPVPSVRDRVFITALLEEVPQASNLEYAVILQCTVAQNASLRRPTTPYEGWPGPLTVELLQPFAYLVTA